MPDSLTPFERPSMRIEEVGGRYYCQDCGRDFEQEEEKS
jgi:transposase-like protein